MDLIADYLAGYSGNTAAAYRRDLADWSAYLAEKEVDLLAVKRVNLDRYARHLETLGRSPSTVARRLSAVSGLYKYAVVEGLLATNPAEHVRRPKVSQESQTLGLSALEARGLIDAATRHGARSEALVKFMLVSALRIETVLALDIADLTVDGGHRVARAQGKGGKIRLVPLASAAKAIDALIGDRTEGPIFVTRTGGRLDRHTAFRTIKMLAANAGITDADRVTPHSLRHTAITAALDAGAASRDVQDFADHADPRMTARYDRSRHNLDRSPAHLLGDHYGKAI